MKGCVGVRAIKKNKYRGLGIQRVKVPPPPPPPIWSLTSYLGLSVLQKAYLMIHNIDEINYAYMFKKSLDRMLDSYSNE